MGHSNILLLGIALMIFSSSMAIDLTNLLSFEQNRENSYKYKLPFGHPCQSDSECQNKRQGNFADNFGDYDSICNNGRCDCAEPYHIREFRKGNYRCSAALDVMRYESLKNFRFCYPYTDTCIDGTCLRVKISNERRSYQCFCGNDEVLVKKTCRKILWGNHSDDCRTPDTGDVPMCDVERNLHCNTNNMKCDCFKNFFYDREGNTCVTAETYVQLYPNETSAGFNESCGIVNNIPKLCDEEMMSCTNSTCKCKREFYPVKSNGTCESKLAFAKANNLTSYKVKPGDYCDSDDECITGLDCFNNLCACPHPCTYDKKTISCDCGEVSYLEGASQAILVGVIGGFFIMIFWYYMILKTIKKGKEKYKFNSNYEGITCVPPPDSATSYSRDPTTYINPSDPHYSTPSYPLHPTTSSYSASAPTFSSNDTIQPLTNRITPTTNHSDFTSPLPSYNSALPDSAPTSPPPSYNSAIPDSAPTSPPPSYNSAMPNSAPTPPPSYTITNQSDIYKPIIS